MKKFYYKPLCIVECVLFLSYKNGNRAPLDLFEVPEQGRWKLFRRFLAHYVGQRHRRLRQSWTASPPPSAAVFCLGYMLQAQGCDGCLVPVVIVVVAVLCCALLGLEAAFDARAEVEDVVVVGNRLHALFTLALYGEFHQLVHELLEADASGFPQVER